VKLKLWMIPLHFKDSIGECRCCTSVLRGIVARCVMIIIMLGVYHFADW